MGTDLAVTAVIARRLVGAMLVVEKIVDFIFPVVDLPKDRETLKELKEYFNSMEKGHPQSLVVLGIIIIGVNFLFFLNDKVTVINKLVTLIPQFALLFEEVYLFLRWKLEKNQFKVIKLIDRFTLFAFLLLMITCINIVMVYFSISKNMNLVGTDLIYVTLIGQISYLLVFFIGYHMYYKKTVAMIQLDYKRGKSTFTRDHKEIAAAIVITVVLSTYRYHIIPEIIFLLIMGILPGIIFFKVAKILVYNRFYSKLFEEEMR